MNVLFKGAEKRVNDGPLDVGQRASHGAYIDLDLFMRTAFQWATRPNAVVPWPLNAGVAWIDRHGPFMVLDYFKVNICQVGPAEL